MIPVIFVWSAIVFSTGMQAEKIQSGDVAYVKEQRVYGVDEVKVGY